MNNITFTIRGSLTDLNTYIHEFNKNRFLANKLKQENTQLVSWVVKTTPRHKVPDMPCVFEFVWYCRDKKKDPDNICAFGTKVILDGLQEAGAMKTDGWSQVACLKHFFRIDPDNPRVEVTIIPTI